jgi:hypothetical protein
LQGNFNQTAFNLLIGIYNESYWIIRPERPEGAAVLQELQTVQNAIGNAQDDLRNNNILKALQELNSAAVEVLKLNQRDSLAEEATEESE